MPLQTFSTRSLFWIIDSWGNLLCRSKPLVIMLSLQNLTNSIDHVAEKKLPPQMRSCIHFGLAVTLQPSSQT